MLDVREYVPKYFGDNREFQVFLRAINVALSVIKSDTDNFIPNLLDPLKCKSRLLPLLANYVGYNYNPRERVLTNRWIVKLYPLLVRNRGNELGITLAIAMSICLMGNPEELNLENHFSMEYDSDYDSWGRKITKLRIYLYTQEYLPILKDMIEAVRPAGMKVEYIPSYDVTSTETIVLNDEFKLAKYDYITGKLLSINNIPITIQNSWPVLIDEYAIKKHKWKHLEDWIWGESKFIDNKPIVSDKTWGFFEDSGIQQYVAMPSVTSYETNKGTESAVLWKSSNIYLTDGRFYDKYGNDLNRYIEPISGKILHDNGEWNGEYVKNARIYTHDIVTNKHYYTGIYFDVSQPAKILNTAYKLLDNDVFNGFYLNNDDMTIYDSHDYSKKYKLVDEDITINGIVKNVWKVYDCYTDIKYNWHVDKSTRMFVMDDIGFDVPMSKTKRPFIDSTHIGKKQYIMIKDNENSDIITPSPYYVNIFGDIVDNAGNVILTKKDRYKVSDSNMIGFSEVHNDAIQLSTLDSTNILQREWSFMKDDHIQNTWAKDKTEDYNEKLTYTDVRYKLTRDNFNIGNPVREYTGSELIRFLSNETLENIKNELGSFYIPLFITEFDNENASGALKIVSDIPESFTLADVFKNINIRFENNVPNDDINKQWTIYIDWTPNSKNTSYFNLSELENPIKFIKCGSIEPRTLHWSHLTEIHISPKVYDGTTKVYTKGDM